MFMRKIKWMIVLLIAISSVGVYLSVHNLHESMETFEGPSIPHPINGDHIVKAAPPAAGTKHGKVSIPGHINTTLYQTNVLRLLSLQSQCNATSEETSHALTDGWPKPKYLYSEETKIKYCPLGQIKLPYWTFVFRMLHEKASTNKQGKKFNLAKVEFGKREAALAKSLFMVRNPYSRLLSIYAEKLLSTEVCKDLSLQTFIDHVMAGMRLKMNLGTILMPMYALCRPCNYNTFAIVTYEDFENDLEYALTAVGARKWKNSIMKNQEKLMYQDESIETLTSMAVRNYKERGCSDMNVLGRHLAEAFHLKGYVANTDHHVFDFEALGMDIDETEESVQKMVHQGLLSAKANVTVRSQTQTEVYSHVTNFTLIQLVATYRFEFDTFGYDKQP